LLEEPSSQKQAMQAKIEIIITAQMAALALLLSSLSSSFAAGPSKVGPDEALKRLLQGNARFVSGHLTHAGPEQIAEARGAVAKSQNPIAVIVGCSDSRVGPELVFDQGLGDLFVVRTAGEVVDSAALGSIEYAVEHLGSPLIVVLGHERCGAVAAAVAGAKEPGHIAAVLKAIEPAVKQTKGKPGDPVECKTPNQSSPNGCSPGNSRSSPRAMTWIPAKSKCLPVDRSHADALAPDPYAHLAHKKIEF
jgi:carbonic anhydrase